MVAEILEYDRPLTFEDLAGFPDDGNRYELLQGELIVSPSPNGLHQTVISRLDGALAAAVKLAKYGKMFVAPFDVRFSPTDVVEPDLFAFSVAQYDHYKGSHFEGAPEFAIEVLSPGSVQTDRVRKASLYMNSRVREYWVVEPVSKRILVHLSGTVEPMPRIIISGTLHSEVIPGFSVNLDELFAPELDTFE
ncbi:MAG: Uma2 family endonuclease [Thermomicrobiales bacterium]